MSKALSNQGIIFFLSNTFCCTKKTLESPLDCKEIKPVNSKGNQPWISIGRTDAEPPILWPANSKSRRIGKDPDAGEEGGQEKKGATKDEMVGWHHRLIGHEFEQSLGDGEGQGSPVCCSPWGHKESDMLERLNNSNKQRRNKGKIQLALHLCIAILPWWKQ